MTKDLTLLDAVNRLDDIKRILNLVSMATSELDGMQRGSIGYGVDIAFDMIETTRMELAELGGVDQPSQEAS